MARAASLEPVWRALGHRLAVTAGAVAALLALLWHAPVAVACLRGGLAWAATLATARGACWLLVRVAPTTVPSSEPEGVEEDSTLKTSEAQAR
jgi:hypothetical protein